MKFPLSISFLFLATALFGQRINPELFGFRHLQTFYKNDTVETLIKSKAGEEQIRKPVFLFCQGSLPIPLLIRHEKEGKPGIYNVFPFTDIEPLLTDYHLVIIGKPYIPLLIDETGLNNDMTYSDSTKKYPRKYIERNLLSYYVDRDIEIIEFLLKQPYVSKGRLIVAGHSEGSAIAAKIASSYPKVTELIYSSGNPLGRMMTLVSRARTAETDSTQQTDLMFQNWKSIVAAPTSMAGGGDTNRSTFEFSSPAPMEHLLKLKIPVLLTFGTRDYGLIQAADYFRLETIRLGKTNFTFRGYAGVEHNFFPVNSKGDIDYRIDNWNRVANDWKEWLRKN
jgi:dienelactone hydrolase